nr:unnamed protein product [Spirometra erinaceieuropaei]
MLMDAYRDERPGIGIAFRTDSQLLNHRRIHFQPSESTTTVYELLFADDCALNTSSEGNMQACMDLFTATCENFSLLIKSEKTVIHPASCEDFADLEENGEDMRSDLRSQPHHRRESQTRGSKIYTAPISQRQRPTASDMFTMFTDIPGATWTPPSKLQHPDCTSRRLSVHLSPASHTVN